jgi:hypothetical protein
MNDDDFEKSEREQRRARDLRHVMKSERSRGTKRQRDTETIKNEEALQKVYERFADPSCSRERFLETILALGLPETSKLIRDLMKAFDERHP